MFVYLPTKKQYRALSDIANCVVYGQDTIRITWRSGLELNTEYKGADAIELIAAINANTNKLASPTSLTESLPDAPKK